MTGARAAPLLEGQLAAAEPPVKPWWVDLMARAGAARSSAAVKRLTHSHDQEARRDAIRLLAEKKEPSARSSSTRPTPWRWWEGSTMMTSSAPRSASSPGMCRVCVPTKPMTCLGSIPCIAEDRVTEKSGERSLTRVERG